MIAQYLRGINLTRKGQVESSVSIHTLPLFLLLRKGRLNGPRDRELAALKHLDCHESSSLDARDQAIQLQA